MRQLWFRLLGAGALACGGSDDDRGPDTGQPTSATGTPSIPLPPPDPLLDGGAEGCPDLGAWTPSDPEAIGAVEEQSQGSSGPVVAPWEGRCFISFARAAAGEERLTLRQSGAAAQGTVLVLTGVVYTHGSDVATFGFGGSAPTLREAQAAPGAWTPFSIAHVVADDGWTVELGADLHTGTGANVFFDALELTVRADAPPYRPHCGDGIVDPDEACDEGPANGVGRCDETCDDAYGDACVIAEDAHCTEDTEFAPPATIDWVASCFANSSETPDGLSGRERSVLCRDVITCIRETRCSSGGRNVENCFCGDIEWEECLQHDPPSTETAVGPCAEQLAAAAGVPPEGTTVGEQVSANRQNVLYPLGDALLLDRCVGVSLEARQICW